jgi:hypothetical protein
LFKYKRIENYEYLGFTDIFVSDEEFEEKEEFRESKS